MLLLSQAPNLSAKRCSLSSSPLNPKFTNPKPFLFSNRKPKLTSTSKPLNLTLAKPEGGIDSSSATKPTTPFHNDQTVFVGQENVPLEGVIQFDKPTSDSSFSSRLNKWGLVFMPKLCSFFYCLDGFFGLMVLAYWVLFCFCSFSRVALLAGGDVLALLFFAAIGRFSHGFTVFDTETLRTADPFIAGTFCAC